MAYKGSYKKPTLSDMRCELDSEGVDLVSLHEDAFYGSTLGERMRRLVARIGVSVCLGCRERLPYGMRFCPECEAKYRRAKTWACGVCGRRLPDCTCSSAFLAANRVPRAVKLLHYHSGRPDAVENCIVLYLKKKDVLTVFRFFAAELERSVRRMLRPADDAVLSFIPRPKERRATYGFDQAQRLAQALEEILAIPVVKTLRRTNFMPAQKEMETMKERIANAKNSLAFTGGEAVKGKTVLLVDDIITTGATMAAAASLLRENGATRVYAVSLATSMRHPNIKNAHEANTHMPRYQKRDG